MKMNKKNVFVLLLVMMVPGVRAQVSLDSLLHQAERNSPDIRTAYQYYENARVRTNLYPENPEIEYGHLWGSPQAIGTRNDLSVSQSFDFPGVYINRSKLSNSDIDKADQLFQGIVQEVLLKTQQYWIDNVFLNKRWRALEKRMDETEHVLNYLQSQYDHGEISKLSLNKAVLIKASLMAVMDELNTDISARQTEIAYLTGGSTVRLEDTVYYPVQAIGIDSVLQISLSDPMYKAYQYDVESQNIRKKLALASGMPKIRTGYYSESIMEENFRGIRLGLSIPLWENANKVKHAEGEILTAEMELEKFRSLQEAKISNLHNRMESLWKQMRQLQSALESTNDPELLALAVKSGEIPLIDYYFGTELYYRVFEEFLVAEKEFYMAEAELTKYDL